MKNKTYLVTGASSGIGRAVAVDISKRGGRVILVSRNEEALRETVQLMENTDLHISIPFDLCCFERYGELFRVLKENEIVLDGMVHCAGVAPVLPLRIVNEKNMKNVFDIHYFAFMELAKYYVKKGTSNGGSIVGISSINVHHPQKCMSVYASAKAAVEAACRSLSIELYEKNIRINSVVLGGVNTNMAKNTDSVISGINRQAGEVKASQIMPIASPQDVTGPILFLLGDESRYITGRNIYVDGGMI